jgi:hypothetical protein
VNKYHAVLQAEFNSFTLAVRDATPESFLEYKLKYTFKQYLDTSENIQSHPQRRYALANMKKKQLELEKKQSDSAPDQGEDDDSKRQSKTSKHTSKPYAKPPDNAIKPPANATKPPANANKPAANATKPVSNVTKPPANLANPSTSAPVPAANDVLTEALKNLPLNEQYIGGIRGMIASIMKKRSRHPSLNTRTLISIRHQ